jgi:hypothetical protein
MAGTFTISGMSAGEPGGERAFGPITIQGAVVIGETLSLLLNSGDNIIPVPTGAVAVMILPPQNNTATLKLRTSLNSSDGGLQLNSGLMPFVYPFPSAPPTSLYLNSQSTLSAFTTLIFI